MEQTYQYVKSDKPQKERKSWDEYFMHLAELAATRSTCDRANVGAVIVNSENRIVSTGYNGSAGKNTPHCSDVGHAMRDGHCISTIHAEINCLSYCAKEGIPVKGCKIYVTHFPCLNCTKSLIQSGITEIYFKEAYGVDDFAVHLMAINGIKVKQIMPENTGDTVIEEQEELRDPDRKERTVRGLFGPLDPILRVISAEKFQELVSGPDFEESFKFHFSPGFSSEELSEIWEEYRKEHTEDLSGISLKDIIDWSLNNMIPEDTELCTYRECPHYIGEFIVNVTDCLLGSEEILTCVRSTDGRNFIGIEYEESFSFNPWNDERNRIIRETYGDTENKAIYNIIHVLEPFFINGVELNDFKMTVKKIKVPVPM